MKQLFEIIVLILVMIASAFAFGWGWQWIYIMGIRESLLPFVTLPIIPLKTFALSYIVYVLIISKFKKDQSTHSPLSSEPYSIIVGKIMTLYMYVLVLGIIGLIC